ncbi:hypothetical protein FRB91_008630, partial [Serendipita sp. 411]
MESQTNVEGGNPMPEEHTRSLAGTDSLHPREPSQRDVSTPTTAANQHKVVPGCSWEVNHYILAIISLSLFGIGVGIIVMWYMVNFSYQGLLPVSNSQYIHYAWTVPPAIIATVIPIVLSAISFKVQRLAPWYAMVDASSAGAPGSLSVFLDYLDYIAFKALYKSFRNGHKM